MCKFCLCLTQRDWSLMRLMNRGDNLVRRTSGEVELETIIKHSAQAFLMPHKLSEHRSKNLGICIDSKTKSVLLKVNSVWTVEEDLPAARILRISTY